ncbi:fibronectin type III domain-containing protein [Candidatus Daviesbacteria bacterium]|nr:fibronectin type III domain-containing protein [Candidatus Daviesbacteria bacterium]
MKLPTLLGLLLLLVALGLGVALYFFREDLLTKQQVVFAPLKIEVANISDNSSTIIWQTQEQAFGDVLLKENSSSIEVLPDDRDGKDPKKRFTHFVTLKNLKPNTKYSFKVRNNNLHYPKDFQEFKTTSAFDKDFREEKPVIGTVIGKDSKPVDEAVVLFKIDGATKLAVFTNPTGNFIILIKNLYTEDLSDLNQKLM